MSEELLLCPACGLMALQVGADGMLPPIRNNEYCCVRIHDPNGVVGRITGAVTVNASVVGVWGIHRRRDGSHG